MKNALIVFIKAPVEGEVKTRLAKTIGNKNAVRVYETLLEQTLTIAKNLYWDTFFYTNKQFSFNKEKLCIQEGEDLGEKMSNAFKDVFRKGYGKVCIIGSDCLSLQTRDIMTAFEALKSKQHVIGPSEDGGYYLLGITTYSHQLFSNIKWSTSEVYQKTTQQISQLKSSYHTLRTLNDIDNIEDLRGHKELADLIK